MRLAAVAFVLSGCGRIDFDASADAGVPMIDAATPHACSWDPMPVIARGPTAHPELSSPGHEFDPYLEPGDPLTLYFASDLILSGGDYDTYVTRRPSTMGAWSTPMKVPGLDESAREEIGFVPERGGLTGTLGRSTGITEVARPDRASPFAFGRVLTELERGEPIFDAYILQDRLTLLFISGPPRAEDLFEATRPDPSSPWGNIRRLPQSGPASDGSPTMTADGLVLTWHNEGEIMFSTRATIAEPFGPPRTMFTDPAPDVEPTVREDGCELFFVRLGDPGNAGTIYSLELSP